MIKRQASSTNNSLIGLSIAAICTVACGWGVDLVHSFFADPYVDQLPPSAKNIQKESFDLFPDWEYYLKADIDEKD